MPSFISFPISLKGIHFSERIARDLFGLFCGFAVWISFRLLLKNQNDLFEAVNALLFSFVLVMPFILVESCVLLFNSEIANRMFSVLSLVLATNKDVTSISKIFGTTPEASLLADQICILWIPFALAAFFSGISFVKKKIFGFSLENLLLVLLLGTLVLTFSRIGFIAFTYINIILLVLFFLNPKAFKVKKIIGYIFGLFIMLFIFLQNPNTKLCNTINSITDIETSINDGIWSNVSRLGSIYSGISIVAKYPLGVGTGIFPFVYEKFLPAWAFTSPEVEALLGKYDNFYLLTEGGDMEKRLPDAKALPIRILAECGIPGFILMTLFWWSVVQSVMQEYIHTRQSCKYQTLSFALLISSLTIPILSFNSSSYLNVHWLIIFAMAVALKNKKNKTVK